MQHQEFEPPEELWHTIECFWYHTINCREFYQLCDGNGLMTACQGNLLVANPYNNGVLTYGVIFKKPEEWNYENGLDFQDTGSFIAFLSERSQTGMSDTNKYSAQHLLSGDYQRENCFWINPGKTIVLYP